MPGAPDTIKRLVETFLHNIDSYKSSIFNETQLRREFLDPFFIALWWDVENIKQIDQFTCRSFNEGRLYGLTGKNLKLIKIRNEKISRIHQRWKQ